MEISIPITNNYIYLPVKGGKPEIQLQLFRKIQGKAEEYLELMVPYEEDTEGYGYDFKAKIPVGNLMGETLIISGEVSEAFLKEIENLCTSYPQFA